MNVFFRFRTRLLKQSSRHCVLRREPKVKVLGPVIEETRAGLVRSDVMVSGVCCHSCLSLSDFLALFRCAMGSSPPLQLHQLALPDLANSSQSFGRELCLTGLVEGTQVFAE